MEKFITGVNFPERPRPSPLGPTGEGRFIKKGILCPIEYSL